jgi:hypothetical protein
MLKSSVAYNLVLVNTTLVVTKYVPPRRNYIVGPRIRYSFACSWGKIFAANPQEGV